VVLVFHHRGRNTARACISETGRVGAIADDRGNREARLDHGLHVATATGNQNDDLLHCALAKDA
jgi:hypothetical protein